MSRLESPPSPGRFPLLPFALLALIILAVIALIIVQGFRHQRDEEIARLQAIADLKVRQISDWLRERQGDAEFVQRGGLFVEQYRRWRESGDLVAAEGLQTRLEQFRQSHGLGAVTLLDPGGKPLWASVDAPRKLAPALQEAAALAAQTGRIRRVGPYLGTAGHPRLDYLAPLAGAGVPAPVVVLHLRPEDWLYGALQAWPVPSDSSEALLFRREGDQILFISELRHRANSALSLRIPVTARDLLAAKLLRGEAPQGDALDGRDYRDVPVLGIVRTVPGTDWFLVAKIDRAEGYGKAFKDAVGIGLAGLFALFLAGAGVILLRQRQQLAFADGIRESQADRLRALNLLEAVADGSADAIFAKDLEGRYILFNRAAGEFVGKTAEQVLGCDDRAIFPPEQAERLMAIGRQVVAEERTITQEMVLSTADGERTFVATKAPLRNGDGRVIGIFGISRDITDRRAAELALLETTNRLSTLVHTIPDLIWLKDPQGVYLACNPRFEAFFGAREAEIVGKTDYDFVDRELADFFREKDQAAIAVGGSSMNEEEVAFASDGHKEILQTIKTPIHGNGGELIGVLGIARNITASKAAEAALKQQAEELRARNEEMERFNRAMVGRELDMIDLKRQINDLCRQLGRQPAYDLDFAAAPPSPAAGDEP